MNDKALAPQLLAIHFLCGRESSKPSESSNGTALVFKHTMMTDDHSDAIIPEKRASGVSTVPSIYSTMTDIGADPFHHKDIERQSGERSSLEALAPIHQKT